jgi:uncharacterized protein (DUF302 family)
MNYYFSKIINSSFDAAIEKVTEKLKQQGFGILTQIDVKETLKQKLDVDFKKYKILGACNPPFAYKALQAEDKIGVFLPCNVIVIEQADNKIEIAAVDPVASMMAIKNTELEFIANEVRSRLQTVINEL